MSRRAGGAGRATGSVRTQREEGELSSRGDHFTGGGRQALQPPALPAVPEWRSGAAVRGKKAPARQGQPPARAGGGRTARLCWHSRRRAAGRAEMGRRLPSPPPLGDRARRTTLPPRWGCPPEGTGWGGAGAGTRRAPCGARAAGWGGAGISEPAEPAGHPGRGKGRKRPVSDTTLRLAAQIRARAAGRSGCFQDLRAGEEPPQRLSLAPTAAAEGSPGQGTGTRPGRGPASFACPCQDVAQGKCAPRSNKFNQIPHLRPHPREHWILRMPPAWSTATPKFSSRHVVKIGRPSYTWSGADDEDGSPGIPSPPVP